MQQSFEVNTKRNLIIALLTEMDIITIDGQSIYDLDYQVLRRALVMARLRREN
ncbi:hypothetical protein AABM27_01570 [Heyndrickxia faecalis]|uniref:hypothetical protein n=1 Tax=Heyndrickxia faecalis TaxID=2824910 RepID=UPI003100BC58